MWESIRHMLMTSRFSITTFNRTCRANIPLFPLHPPFTNLIIGISLWESEDFRPWNCLTTLCSFCCESGEIRWGLSDLTGTGRYLFWPCGNAMDVWTDRLGHRRHLLRSPRQSVEPWIAEYWRCLRYSLENRLSFCWIPHHSRPVR